MKRLSSFIGAVIIFCSCEKYEPTPVNSSELESHIAGLVGTRTKKLPFEPPVAWAMVKAGRMEANYFQGSEVPGGNVSVSDRSLFILASAAKLFTSVMVMKAVEDKKIQLTAKASDYLDWLPQAWRNITIDQLLAHADGVPDVGENAKYKKLPMETTEYMSRRDYLSYAAELPLHFKAGLQTRYGQTGYVILSVILEKVYGKPYEKVVQETILTPLEMNDTHFITHHSEIVTFRPQIFEPDGNTFKKVTPGYVYADYATAGLCSNLKDMIKFICALQSHQVLSAQNFRRLYTPVKGLSGFALGWEYRYKDGELMAGHSGGWSVVVMHLPKSNTTSIFLSSAADESILNTGYQVAEKVKQFVDTP